MESMGKKKPRPRRSFTPEGVSPHNHTNPCLPPGVKPHRSGLFNSMVPQDERADAGDSIRLVRPLCRSAVVNWGGCCSRAGTGSLMGNQAGELEPWRIYGDRVVYDNPWVQLALVDVEPPGVPRFEHHVVRLKRVAIAAVLDTEDRVLMLWRYRFVPDVWGWELPGGMVDPGETGLQAALREVEEETGWRPDHLEHVVTFQPMVGMVDSPHEVFVGEGAVLVGEPEGGEEAGNVSWVPLGQIPALMAEGKLTGSGTLVALLHILASRKV